MKGGTVQISWHDMKPVLCLDFHHLTGLLATGGADSDIKMWVINSEENEKKVPSVSYQASLSYHGGAVNALRFSPSGEHLASGADGGELIIWKLHSSDDSKTWKVLKTLSFHRKDVLDLQWSADGSFLISGSVDNSCIIWDVNKGSYKFTPASEPANTAYVFSRKDLTRPALMLPGASKPVIAVRFCPMTFSLRGSSNSSFFKLPYRLIFAVATLNSLYIYDTESVQPIAVVAGLHYAAVTDIAWSATGKYLALSSQDGYCTLLEFDNEELGSAFCRPGKEIAGDDKNNVQKQEETVPEIIASDKCMDIDSAKTEVKQESTISTPQISKAPRKRITPMAID